MNLFQTALFTLHSGKQSLWKIDCDALTDSDLSTLAHTFGRASYDNPYGEVYGVPSGGLRFAEHLKWYTTKKRPILIVDDVLTTGKSMEEMKKKLNVSDAIGLVIFARGQCPDWVTPIFQLHASFT